VTDDRGFLRRLAPGNGADLTGDRFTLLPGPGEGQLLPIGYPGLGPWGQSGG
jgi:hypothetical protein